MFTAPLPWAPSGARGLATCRLLTLASVAVLLSGCAGAADVRPPQPTGPAAAACRALAERLPEQVGDQERRETEPGSRFTAAWGDPAITLRCGVPKPRALTRTAQLFTVNGVAWLPVPQHADVPTGFYVVERRAYVELVVPEEHAPASDALVDVGKPISRAVPKDPNA